MSGTTCGDCGGTGFTVQGWTDKNGYSEDQYGPCWACARRRQRAALVDTASSCSDGPGDGVCACGGCIIKNGPQA